MQLCEKLGYVSYRMNDVEEMRNVLQCRINAWSSELLRSHYLMSVDGVYRVRSLLKVRFT